ncbi:MAG TPA: hypothetical protein VGV67_10160, partial [Solirubrobacteraceae bacterium]|nr:hypothetical protein [Solirubrobacteraceae bacterium]
MSGGRDTWYGAAAPPLRPITPPAVALVDDPAHAPPALQYPAAHRPAAYGLWRATFPAQEAALQTPLRPDTTRWALLVGVNEHEGLTRDNLG